MINNRSKTATAIAGSISTYNSSNRKTALSCSERKQRQLAGIKEHANYDKCVRLEMTHAKQKERTMYMKIMFRVTACAIAILTYFLAKLLLL